MQFSIMMDMLTETNAMMTTEHISVIPGIEGFERRLRIYVTIVDYDRWG